MIPRRRKKERRASYTVSVKAIGRAVCAVLWMCLLAPGVVGSETRALGSAYDKETGEFLYNELHRCFTDEKQCLVEYRDPAGELLAAKELDYFGRPYQPSLVVTDYRSGTELHLDGPADDALVVDAGFDNFIRSRWEILDSGGSVQFNFLVPGRNAPISMRANRDMREDCDPGELCIQVGLDSWLLARFVDPILLTYSTDDRLLLSYDGPGNLLSRDGFAPSVVIHYEHLEAQQGDFLNRGDDDVIANDWTESRIAR